SEVGGTEAEVEESQRYRDFCSACKLFVEVLVPSIWDGFEVHLMGGSSGQGLLVGGGGGGEVLEGLGKYVAVVKRWEMKVVLEEKRQKAAAAAAIAAALKAEEDKAAAVVAESAVNAGVEEAVNAEETKSVEPVVDQANALVEQPLEEKQQSRGASLDQRRQQSPVRQKVGPLYYNMPNVATKPLPACEPLFDYTGGNAIHYISQQIWNKDRRSWCWNMGQRSPVSTTALPPTVFTNTVLVQQYPNGTAAGSPIVLNLPCLTGYTDALSVHISVVDPNIPYNYVEYLHSPPS
ncbi:hypothetical protein HDU99_007925, partial [Rhizoclosmatium hyalinum]